MSRILTKEAREKSRARSKKWYAENSARALEQQRLAYAADPEPKRESARAWQLAHPEIVRAKSRRWYEDNRDVALARNRKWREDHPNEWRAINAKAQAKRRAVKRGVYVEDVDPQVVFERDNWQCRICEAETHGSHPALTSPTLDHIVPISKGGEHSYANVQCACFGCNSRKGASIQEVVAA